MFKNTRLSAVLAAVLFSVTAALPSQDGEQARNLEQVDVLARGCWARRRQSLRASEAGS
jgi:hypothetical protein